MDVKPVQSLSRPGSRPATARDRHRPHRHVRQSLHADYGPKIATTCQAGNLNAAIIHERICRIGSAQPNRHGGTRANPLLAKARDPGCPNSQDRVMATMPRKTITMPKMRPNVSNSPSKTDAVTVETRV